VLLVEDEPMGCKVSEGEFTSLGFAVLLAKGGVDAVEVFRQHRDEVCCVLCDLTMPHMNGWETLNALRKLAPAFPVILASGYDKAYVMAGDHPELPQAFLNKPDQIQGRRDAVGRALAHGKKSSGS
jgi:two-component system, cell cycle sensor histidine kinase and response regulator CckA